MRSTHIVTAALLATLTLPFLAGAQEKVLPVAQVAPPTKAAPAPVLTKAEKAKRDENTRLRIASTVNAAEQNTLMLENSVTKISMFIDLVKIPGTDFTDAKANLIDAKAKIDQAKKLIAEIKASSPKVGLENKEQIQNLRDQLKQVRTLTKQIHAAAKESIAKIRAMKLILPKAETAATPVGESAESN